MKKVIGYLRVSTDTQDLEKQRYLLLDYAQKNQIKIDEFIEVEISSRKNRRDRKIDEILEKFGNNSGMLLVAELSRLGRNMLEVLNIINELSDTGIKIVFVRQPELSTTGTHTKLLLAVYSYFAEAERDFISIRTKQGLEAAKAKGVKLGRRKGCRNKKSRRLDQYRDQIADSLKKGFPMKSILIILNNQLEVPISYTALRYFIDHDPILKDLKKLYIKPRGLK